MKGVEFTGDNFEHKVVRNKSSLGHNLFGLTANWGPASW